MPWKQKPFGWGKVFSGEALFPRVQGATVAVLEQVKELVAEDTTINEIIFSVEAIEPPSVELAIQLMLDQAGSKLKFEYICESDLTPDPRASNANRPLWVFKHGRPKPGVSVPDDRLKLACAKLAKFSVDCEDSWRLAMEEAASMGAEDVQPLLSVMVFPPAVESDFTSTDWIRRVQLAAAQIATCVELAEGVPLSDSKVVDVTRGPLDWSVDSAMVATAQRVQAESKLIDEVCELVQGVLLRVPEKGTWSCRDVGKSVLRFLTAQRPSNTPSSGL